MREREGEGERGRSCQDSRHAYIYSSTPTPGFQRPTFSSLLSLSGDERTLLVSFARDHSQAQHPTVDSEHPSSLSLSFPSSFLLRDERIIPRRISIRIYLYTIDSSTWFWTMRTMKFGVKGDERLEE